MAKKLPVNFFIFFIFTFLACNEVSAEIYKPSGPEFFEQNLKKSRYELDTAADAIVLYEKVYFTVYISNKYGLCQHKYVHKIIKILTDEGKHYADVVDMAGFNKYYFAVFTDIAGKTYNWQDSKIKESILDPSTAKRESESSSLYSMKFSMPDVGVGSIIDYEFCLDQPLSDIFGFWPFQEKLPKIYSEVEVKTDNNMLYRDVSKSFYEFKKFDDGSNVVDTLIPMAFYNSVIAINNVSTRRWIRRNLVAYHEEPFVTNMQNYLEQIFFQVNVQLYYFSKGGYKYLNFVPNWKEINHRYLTNEYFLKELETPSMQVNKQVYYATGNTHDSLQLAKNIFRYVRDNFSVGTTGISYKQTLEELVDEKRGAAYKINLLLIAMLRKAGFSCDPVLITTTANMRMKETLPITDFIDYTATKVHVAGKDYFLDPANKYVQFGALSSKCYNGYARVVTKDSGYAISLTPDMMVNRDITIVKSVDETPDHYSLHIKHYFGNLVAANYRQKWKNDSVKIKDLISSEMQEGFELDSFRIVNFSNPDTVLSLEYTVSTKWQAATVYVPAFLYKFYAKNPFKELERNYPIEMPYAREDSYILDLAIPKGYKLADSVISTYYEFSPQTNFKYTAVFDTSAKQLHINAHLSERKTYFDNTDYLYLKKFYSDIISAQQTTYVFKKHL